MENSLDITETSKIERLRPSDIDKIVKMGFVTHAILEPTTSPKGMSNDHTHGFPATLNHPDFQIVMPIDPQISHEIFGVFYERIKKGETFKEGQEVEGILQAERKVKLIEATEMNRTLLRIIIPDPQGSLESELPVWKDQASMVLLEF